MVKLHRVTASLGRQPNFTHVHQLIYWGFDMRGQRTEPEMPTAEVNRLFTKTRLARFRAKKLSLRAMSIKVGCTYHQAVRRVRELDGFVKKSDQWAQDHAHLVGISDNTLELVHGSWL